MELFCDDRERQVWKCAENKYDNVYSEHLTIGDFLIGLRSAAGGLFPLAIIERKTWEDLAASLKDGRVHNINKLRSYREETGARIAYLMEGTAPKMPETALVGGIPYQNLRAHLDHLLYRDGIIELYSSGPADSLRRLLEFGRNIVGLAEAGQGSCPDGVAAAKIKIELTDDQITDKIWASFEGISLASARAFRSYRIGELYTGSVKEVDIANVQTGSRKFGPARASALFASLSREQTLEKILRAVPNIASKKARLIIDCMADGIRVIPLADLFVRWNDFKPVLQLKIGKKCAENIEKFLVRN